MPQILHINGNNHTSYMKFNNLTATNKIYHSLTDNSFTNKYENHKVLIVKNVSFLVWYPPLQAYGSYLSDMAGSQHPNMTLNLLNCPDDSTLQVVIILLRFINCSLFSVSVATSAVPAATCWWILRSQTQIFYKLLKVKFLKSFLSSIIHIK